MLAVHTTVNRPIELDLGTRAVTGMIDCTSEVREMIQLGLETYIAQLTVEYSAL